MLDRLAALLGRHIRLATAVSAVVRAVSWVRRSATRAWVWPILVVGAILGLWWLISGLLGDAAVPQWWQFALAFVAVPLFAALSRARQRTVIQPFTDHTDDGGLIEGTQGGLAGSVNAAAVPDLLASELAGIRDLYRSVSEQRAGAATSSAAGQYASLDVTAAIDDVAAYLSDVVPSSAEISLGPLKIPVGAAMAVLARAFRGPRISGSVHHSGDYTAVFATFSGPSAQRSWTVRSDELHEGTAPQLQQLVRALAVKITADLTFGGAVHWESLLHLNAGLDSYHRSVTSGRRHPLHLSQAESEFSHALAEDCDFGWIYYNLGLVYEAATTDSSSDPSAVTPDRAARAYERAIVANPRRWEPYYALARRIHEGDPHLQKTRRLCQRVRILTRSPRARAQAYLIESQVLRATAEHPDSEQTWNEALAKRLRTLTQRAAGYAWINLYARQWAPRTASATQLARTRALVSDCLVGVGQAQLSERSVQVARKPLKRRDNRSLRACTRVFARAASLSPDDGNIAQEWGQALCELSEWTKATEALKRASQAQPQRDLVWAWLAWAQANVVGTTADDADKRRRADLARESCRIATGSAFRGRSRLANDEEPLRDDVFEKCADTYRLLHEQLHQREDEVEERRVRAMPDVVRDLARIATEDVSQLAPLRERLENCKQAGENWEAAQVAIAIAKILSPQTVNAAWRPQDDRDAAELLGAAIKLLGNRHSKEIRRRMLYPYRARLLRRSQQLTEALSTASLGTALDPTNYEAAHQFAKSLLRLGEARPAGAAWEAAQKWNPPQADSPDVHYQLGVCYWSLSNGTTEKSARDRHARRAVSEMHRALDLGGSQGTDLTFTRGELWQLLGDLHLSLGEFDQAATCFVPALRHATSEQAVIARYYLARSWARQHRFPAAEQLFKVVVAEIERGYSDQPETDAMTVVEYGKSAQSRISLLCRGHLGMAWCIAARLGASDEALKHVDAAREALTAIEPRPGSGAVVPADQQRRREELWTDLTAVCDEYAGWIRYRYKGDLTEAIRLLTASVERKDDLEACHRLAEVHLAQAQALVAEGQPASEDLRRARLVIEHVADRDHDHLHRRHGVRLRRRLAALTGDAELSEDLGADERTIDLEPPARTPSSRASSPHEPQ